MMSRFASVVSCLFVSSSALRYDPAFLDYNLNQNPNAVHPVDYSGEWENHTFHPSPDNWRFPFYTITQDRWVNGDPRNDEANGTVFEHDWMTNQFRFGGDAKGLMGSLDYVQGMGVKAIYLAGSPFLNFPWSGDGYGPLDFTLLDSHHGTIDDWRALIAEIHQRDMYVLLDNTMATMGDLIGFQGHLNESTPFSWNEYNYEWKSDRRYHDFQPGNDHNASCQYPRMWEEDGYLVGSNITKNMHDGCKASEFDQYGDMKGVGAYPAWQSQLSKFASVQDRLRAWNDDVREKIKVMSCIQISMLDIDGFRMDKALQTTIDAQADFSSYQRACAKKYGKDNFLIVGEVVGEIPLAALYMGRGKNPDQSQTNSTAAMLASNASNPSEYIREFGLAALDGAAFHYPTYGALTRFLGLSGPIGFEGVDWVEHWSSSLATDDMVNSNTGKFDPRHLYGVTNQDVFRWPALSHGIERQLLGLFVTTLEMPGIPLTLWGEEQAFYVLENLASDYVFGRTPMASSRAWQLHGCYHLGEEVYVDMPFNSSAYACHDDSVSLDHRDPSHYMRNIIKRMYELRREFPVLNDGYELKSLSSQTEQVYLPGSGNISTPTGIWSVYRGRAEQIQNFDGTGQGNSGVWMVYSNRNTTYDYSFDCSNSSAGLISAFPANTVVKNLFYPYDEYTVGQSNVTYGIEGSSELNGCLSGLTMAPWEYKAFVPKRIWSDPAPTITHINPGHDERIQSRIAFGEQATLPLEIHFSSAMDCDSVANSLEFSSTSFYGVVPAVDRSSIQCKAEVVAPPPYVGAIGTAWIFSAQLTNVTDGVHTITVANASSSGGLYTNARDTFMFRFGQPDNPMIFPLSANYTNGVLQKDQNTGELYIAPRAPGADLIRYSLNFGTSWSDWVPYTGNNMTLTPQVWSGTKAQSWTGEHVVLNFWSEKTGSAEHIQHSDLNRGNLPARRWPHVSVQGSWNSYGYDNGMSNMMNLDKDGLWKFDLLAEWPTNSILNVWGINPDGTPDKSKAFGDVDGDGVLDWTPPDSLSQNVINMSAAPPFPHLGYRIVANDGNYNYALDPVGSAWNQLIVAILMAIVPVITAITGVYLFKRSFYQVKFNEVGVPEKQSFMASVRNLLPMMRSSTPDSESSSDLESAELAAMSSALVADTGAPDRRTVLIATMEYEIEDWAIKVKIGGLGVMASLMAKNLGHQDLVWVVPCVGDIEYPSDTPGEVMTVQILDNVYEIEVQYHKLRNITFVLLDAPIFRKQTKAEPYPARMDDLDSAIFYSAWNTCIAKAIKRFNVDLYHINDYHGAVAPLHLLPRTIPVCLSLHNAEFQGLWPLRTEQETEEICRVFNLSRDVVQKYVQFGEVFNLLHAGASYLRIHQKGFGAVGVSKKYGKRSFARYPIFWGLNSIGALPNPDPSDTGEWNKKAAKIEASAVQIDEAAQAERGNLRRQAQEWAGLDVDPTAELFVFVGRWSQQKGVDLIADVFFSILEEHPKAQLICIGPVIDLYGKFAALKLAKMMEKYPGRVFSKPEFTALPPYIFSGAEFALIPSRDEPFGLVAVEFGRKGALGVGSRVGGLGQMPGWWFTIESTTTKHLIGQFKSAIRSALGSGQETRAVMRVRSGMQRFPVAQWVEDLEILQSRSIKAHDKNASSIAPSMFHFSSFREGSRSSSRNHSTFPTPLHTAPNTAPNSRPGTRPQSRVASPLHSPIQSRAPSPIREDNSMEEDDSVPPSPRFPPGAKHSFQRKVALNASKNNSISSFQDLAAVANGIVSRGRIDETDEHPSGSLTPPSNAYLPSRPGTPPNELDEDHDPFTPPFHATKSKSVLSLQSIVGESTDFNLQKTDPFFTDTTGVYYHNFEKMLDGVDSKNSAEKYSIEKYLIKSEKKWFEQRHSAKLGISTFSTPRASFSEKGSRPPTVLTDGVVTVHEVDELEQFNLGNDFVPIKGLKRFLQRKIGNWQIYSLILAFGQIIAANSYQINLITGANGESALKLYLISTIYVVATLGWWFIYGKLRSIYVLSLPFAFYGAAFFLLGMAPYTNDLAVRGWIYNVATAFYAVASASGSFFFALNFGSEGGAPVKTWVFRACGIQGTQQIYVIMLWYWGSTLSNFTSKGGKSSTLVTSTRIVTAITVPIAVLLWVIGFILFFGLPQYFRQRPGKVPSFYAALFRRKIVLWFILTVILQNFWLSAPSGRNWRYLFSSSHAPTWSIVLVVIIFFIFIWAGILFFLSRLSRQHTWLFPILGTSLGAPRWCQILWSCSGIGMYVPWGGVTVGAVLGRALWAWLGVLDALQGVGLGMVLLQTLTRVHVLAVLVAAQGVGALATMAGRAWGPDGTTTGSVFPDFGIGGGGGFGSGGRGLFGWEFWVGLGCQILVCVGFFAFFRKEQLSKP